jgi:hypothetical protein
MGDRRAEDRHDAVADELVDDSLVTVYHHAQVLKAIVHQKGQLLGIEELRHRGESGDIGKGDGDVAAFLLD